MGTQGIGIILVGTPLYSNLCLFMDCILCVVSTWSEKLLPVIAIEEP